MLLRFSNTISLVSLFATGDDDGASAGAPFLGGEINREGPRYPSFVQMVLGRELRSWKY